MFKKVCGVLACVLVISTISTASFAQFSLFGEQAEEEAEISVFDTLPADIQEEIIEEAEKARSLCEQRSNMAVFHDCDCIAANFLEERARDPASNRTILVSKLTKQCPNVPGIAGKAYQDCKTVSGSMDFNVAEAFCTCVGNRTATAFSERPTDRLSGITSLTVGARTQCMQELNIGANR